MEITIVNEDNFNDVVLNSKELVLVDFNANWCGPCRMLKPILEEIAKEDSSIKIVSVNIDDNDILAEEYNVSSIPCLVLFKDGKEINRSIGLKSKDEIKEVIGVN